jgi:predicted alpha/beta-fold hydrolase
MEQLLVLGREYYQTYSRHSTPTRLSCGIILRQFSLLGKRHSVTTLPRQKLDVYTPANVSEKSPILVSLYGGGFVGGDRTEPCPPAPKSLVHVNLGYYFTSHGFITVVVDYRRTGEGARFPSGGEDLNAAISWLQKRHEAGTRDLYLMGNSAGGAHLTTFLLHDRFREMRRTLTTSDARLILRGAVLVSAPFAFPNANPKRKEVLAAYFGGRITEDCPLGLLQRAKGGLLGNAKVLLLTASLDPEDEILAPTEEFVAL